MERIDLFDRYINNQLSEEELSDFKKKLKSDNDFAEEFKIYLLCVDGIIKEAEQDNLDFGHALKSISLEELKNIIGKDSSLQEGLKGNPLLNDKSGNNDVVIRKPIKFKHWIWIAASYGILIGGGAIWIAKADRDARYAVDNAIYACADIYSGGTRDAMDLPDITKLNDKDLKDKLPRIEEIFRESHSPENIYDSGYSLAMAYLRLHERNKAKQTMEELIKKLSPYDDFSEEISQIEAILKVLN